MSRVILFPHRQADEGSLEVQGWWLERRGSRVPLPRHLDDWDYQKDEVVGVTLRIDGDLLLRSSAQKNLRDLELFFIADCAGAQRRLVERYPLHTVEQDDVLTCVMTLPPRVLAGSIKFRVLIALAHSRPDDRSGAAHDRGARILTVRGPEMFLEGEASRFPVEAVPFSTLGLDDIPWTLDLEIDDFGKSFMGSVRLFVNTENPVGRMLLEDSMTGKIAKIVMADVLRLLVATAAASLPDVQISLHEEGSVAHAIDSMCHSFLDRSVVQAVTAFREDPVYFERLIQARIQPLNEALA